MTRRERLERKLEKRKEWAGKAEARAVNRFDTAHKATEHIPMGQPILVDHHSAKRHRADLNRSDTNMRKGVEETNLAKHHTEKADGLEIQLESTVFSDDPDAIEQLEAKIATAEEKQKFFKDVNRIVRGKPKNESTPEKIEKLKRLHDSIDDATAARFFEPDFCGRIGIASYALQNNNANIRRMKTRVKDVKRLQARTARAEASENGVVIESEGNSAQVTFAEFPGRDTINTLKSAGYHWSGGSWFGYLDKLPQEISDLESGAV